MPQSSQQSERAELILSPTAREASRRLQEHEPVSAAAFAKAIFERHSEYASHKASALALDETRADHKRLIQVWLEDIRTLFDLSRAPELHGRLVILGLSILEPDLRQWLQQDGFLTALEQELKGPLDDMLTARGRASRDPSESVPIQPYNPLRRVTEDELGRAAFARYLAARICAIVNQKQAYSIHLYGPWGVGKSTVLNFLRVEQAGLFRCSQRVTDTLQGWRCRQGGPKRTHWHPLNANSVSQCAFLRALCGYDDASYHVGPSPSGGEGSSSYTHQEQCVSVCPRELQCRGRT